MAVAIFSCGHRNGSRSGFNCLDSDAGTSLPFTGPRDCSRPDCTAASSRPSVTWVTSGAEERPSRIYLRSQRPTHSGPAVCALRYVTSSGRTIGRCRYRRRRGLSKQPRSAVCLSRRRLPVLEKFHEGGTFHWGESSRKCRIFANGLSRTRLLKK